MDATYPPVTAIAARPVTAVSARQLDRAGRALCCLVAMTAGLWVDSVRDHYLSLDICSVDASLARRLALHIALLPVSCLAMYATTIFALCVTVRRGKGPRGVGRALIDAAWVTAQIAAGATIMDMPPVALAGDGYKGAWLAMAVAMAGAHALRCGLDRTRTTRREIRHGDS